MDDEPYDSLHILEAGTRYGSIITVYELYAYTEKSAQPRRAVGVPPGSHILGGQADAPAAVRATMTELLGFI